jgi:hypothetical protein
MLHNPYCSPSTSRAEKTSGVNYIPPGLVKDEIENEPGGHDSHRRDANRAN